MDSNLKYKLLLYPLIEDSAAFSISPPSRHPRLPVKTKSGKTGFKFSEGYSMMRMRLQDTFHTGILSAKWRVIQQLEILIFPMHLKLTNHFYHKLKAFVTRTSSQCLQHTHYKPPSEDTVLTPTRIPKSDIPHHTQLTLMHQTHDTHRTDINDQFNQFQFSASASSALPALAGNTSASVSAGNVRTSQQIQQSANMEFNSPYRTMIHKDDYIFSAFRNSQGIEIKPQEIRKQKNVKPKSLPVYFTYLRINQLDVAISYEAGENNILVIL